MHFLLTLGIFRGNYYFFQVLAPVSLHVESPLWAYHRRGLPVRGPKVPFTSMGKEDPYDKGTQWFSQSLTIISRLADCLFLVRGAVDFGTSGKKNKTNVSIK